MKALLLTSLIAVCGCVTKASTLPGDGGITQRFQIVDIVRTGDNDKELNLVIQEAHNKGPACDLVIQYMNYDAAAKTLEIRIDQATFCPLDSIAQRKAFLNWVLPNELRGQDATLDLIANGQKLTTLKLNPAPTK